MNKFGQVSCYITSNWIRIDSQYSPHSVPMLALTLPNPKLSSQHTWHTLHQLIGHTTFPRFLHPTFRQWHWCPHNVDINNSSIHGSRFRKEVVSYQFFVSKSLVIIANFSISLHQCILFYYVSLILTQFPVYVMFYSFTIMFCKA